MAPKTQRRLVLVLMGVCAVLAVAIVFAALHKTGAVTVVRELQEHAAVKEFWRLNANDPKSIEVVEWLPTWDATQCDVGEHQTSLNLSFWAWRKLEVTNGTIVRVRYREKRLGSLVLLEGAYYMRDGAVVGDMSGLGVRLRSEGQLSMTSDKYGLDTERVDKGARNFMQWAQDQVR